MSDMTEEQWKQIKEEFDRRLRSIPNECFVFFSEYLVVAEELPKKQRDAVVVAIVDYGLYSIWPDNLKGTALAVFKSNVRAIDRGLARAESGRRGGRPKKKGEGIEELETES